jgi:hypothetical protein
MPLSCRADAAQCLFGSNSHAVTIPMSNGLKRIACSASVERARPAKSSTQGSLSAPHGNSLQTAFARTACGRSSRGRFRCGARSSGCVGLNGSGFGRTDSAKQREAGTMTAILEARTAQNADTPPTPVFAAPIEHPSAWTVADFRSPADYSVDLDAAQLRDIAAAMRRINAAGIGLDGVQCEHFDLAVPSRRGNPGGRSRMGAASCCCGGCRSRITRKTISA